MILYESNKNWLRDVMHLSRSWTMQKILRSTLWVGFGTALISFLDIDILGLDHWRIDGSVFSLLGIVLSILLVFRTNSAYDRWWEGRRQWGSLVNNSRNLAVYLHAALPREDIQTRRHIAVCLANFGIALKEHLRDGVKADELIGLSPAEKEIYSSKSHLPSFIVSRLQQSVQENYRNGNLTGEDHLNIKVHTQELLDILGSCERIRKTPIPFSYNVYLKLYISAYTIILPFGLIPHFGYVSILFVMFIFFAFIGVELMAEEIEDPFGLDCNDLPTGTIAETIRKNVFEIFELEHGEEEQQDILYAKEF